MGDKERMELIKMMITCLWKMDNKNRVFAEVWKMLNEDNNNGFYDTFCEYVWLMTGECKGCMVPEKEKEFLLFLKTLLEERINEIK